MSLPTHILLIIDGIAHYSDDINTPLINDRVICSKYINNSEMGGISDTYCLITHDGVDHYIILISGNERTRVKLDNFIINNDCQITSISTLIFDRASYELRICLAASDGAIYLIHTVGTVIGDLTFLSAKYKTIDRMLDEKILNIIDLGYQGKSVVVTSNESLIMEQKNGNTSVKKSTNIPSVYCSNSVRFQRKLNLLLSTIYDQEDRKDDIKSYRIFFGDSTDEYENVYTNEVRGLLVLDKNNILTIIMDICDDQLDLINEKTIKNVSRYSDLSFSSLNGLPTFNIIVVDIDNNVLSYSYSIIDNKLIKCVTELDIDPNSLVFTHCYSDGCYKNKLFNRVKRATINQ